MIALRKMLRAWPLPGVVLGFIRVLWEFKALKGFFSARFCARKQSLPALVTDYEMGL